MRFDQWSYLWPPRPEKAVSSGSLGFYEKLGYMAQLKLNGACNIMSVHPDRSAVKCMGRHQDDHKAWRPSTHTAKPFQNLPGDGWYVFIAELMHSKVSGLRDINYIHDVVVANGVHLVGSTFEQRQDILQGLFKTGSETISHRVIDDHTWLAKTYDKDLAGLFKRLDKPEYEGLVLKDPHGKLKPCFRQTANASWQVKCRRPAGNYTF